MGKYISLENAIKTAWMILDGLGFHQSSNPELIETVNKVFDTAPAENADRIRQMSDEELARQFALAQADTAECLGDALGLPIKYTEEEISDASKEWLDWLKQEVKDNA